MAIALDIIILLIILTTFVSVVKKGFVRTILDLTSFVGAWLAAKFFSPSLSGFFFDGLSKSVSESINNMIAEKIKQNTLPEPLYESNLSAFLEKYNIDINFSAVNNTVDGMVENTVLSITNYLISILSYVLAFIVIFVLVLILFKVASVLFGGIFKLPILNTVDKTLAIILAVIISVIYLLLFIALMQIIMPFLMSVYPQFFNDTVIGNTFIFEYLYNFEWLKFFC